MIKVVLHTKAAYFRYISVEGFQEFSDVRSTMSWDSKLQLDLLRRILYLTDLHEANYGIDGKGNLCIVDFEVFDFPTVKLFDSLS